MFGLEFCGKVDAGVAVLFGAVVFGDAATPRRFST